MTQSLHDDPAAGEGDQKGGERAVDRKTQYKLKLEEAVRNNWGRDAFVIPLGDGYHWCLLIVIPKLGLILHIDTKAKAVSTHDVCSWSSLPHALLLC